jgi:hypothetical protein
MTEFLNGWGRGTWGQLEYGEGSIPLSITAPAAGSVGTPVVAVNAQAIASVGGVTASLGAVSVTIQAEANVTPSGQLAAANLGTPTLQTVNNISVTGLSSTSAVGSVTTIAKANVDATGLEATTAFNPNVVVTGIANVTTTGLEAQSELASTGPEFTAFGNAALSTTQQKFGTASLELDGTGDYVKSNATTFIDGNFTVEFFVYSDDFLQDSYLWDTQVSNSGLAIALTSTGKLRVLKDNTIVINVNSGLTNDTWNHIALLGNGNFLNIYVNGTPRGQYLTTGGNSYPNQPYYIGCRHTEADFFSGYIDEFRASKVARYSGIFTPTTTEFSVDFNTNTLLHFDGANGSTDIINSAIQIEIAFGITFSIDGQSATASVGDVTTDAEANVVLALDGATGAVGVVAIWGIIDDSQTPNYNTIDSSQVPNYSTITDTQDPNWEEVA